MELLGMLVLSRAVMIMHSMTLQDLGDHCTTDMT